MNLYLDMDGVLADFDRAYEDRFGVPPRSHDDKVLWANIDGCEDFFRTIPPCAGALEFFADVKHLNPIILTACPKTGYAKAAQHKREWIRKHLGPDVVVLPVMGGVNKPLFMHAPGDVLVDDYRRNTEAWDAAGGWAILHRDWDTTRWLIGQRLGHVSEHGEGGEAVAPVVTIDLRGGGRLANARISGAQWLKILADQPHSVDSCYFIGDGAGGPMIRRANVPQDNPPTLSATVGVEERVRGVIALLRKAEPDNGEKYTEHDAGYDQASREIADMLERALAPPAATHATPDDVALDMGPDDVPRLLIAGAQVARFPKGSWTEVCEAFDFGGYRNEQPAATPRGEESAPVVQMNNAPQIVPAASEDVPSRSRLRRIAAEKGEPAPRFDAPAQEKG